MAANAQNRHYMVFRSSPGLLAVYNTQDGPTVLQYLATTFHLSPPGGDSLNLPFRVVNLPSTQWSFAPQVDKRGPPPHPDKLVIAAEFEDLQSVLEIRRKLSTDTSGSYLGMGVDIVIQETEHWCPLEATSSIFGTRDEADRLIDVEYLRQQELTGEGVNVVVVDQGVDSRFIKNFGGGWTIGATQPGRTRGGHGAMMVRNILDVAPDATIYDCPLIPPRITKIAGFLQDAEAAYIRMITDISYYRDMEQWRGPWIFVNAWAIFNRNSEQPPGDYTNNPSHPFNLLIGQAVDNGFDLVFCAGNCGQFCPDRRCGARDQGPGESIFGANSHPRVLTVSAVRVDDLWLGYSSQGPGQPNLDQRKPDICAPSQFCETQDAHLNSTGTSAATGIAAGVLAALRGKWDASRFTPDNLKGILLLTARRTQALGWNDRLGNGILDAKAAYDLAAHLSP